MHSTSARFAILTVPATIILAGCREVPTETTGLSISAAVAGASLDYEAQLLLPGSGEVIGISNTGDVLINTFSYTGSQSILWRRGEVVPLGSLGGNYTNAIQINDHGVVIGGSTTSTGEARGFIWQHGRMTDLGTLGGWSISPAAVNVRGQVVGTGTNADGAPRGFVWDKGTMREIGIFACPWPNEPWVCASSAVDINDRGEVIGHATASDGARSPFIWRDGAMTPIEGLLEGGSYTFVRRISPTGKVIGAGDTRPLGFNLEFHAWVWDGVTMTDLGTLGGGVTTEPVAIDAQGRVIGWSETAPYTNAHAFLWQDGVMTDLGTLGGSTSMPTAIGPRGEVVGFSQTANGAWHAFLWQDGVMHDLGIPDGLPDNSGARAINPAGLIAGHISGRPVLWSR